MNKSKLVVLGVLCTFVLCAFVWENDGKIKDSDGWKDYKKWYRVTEDEPNTGDPTGFLQGKHKGTEAYREIYISKKGEAVSKGHAPYSYPAGTILVKEAYKNKAAWQAKKKPVLTVMVKGKKGSAPNAGDWTWYMGTAKKNLFMNFQKFCTKCHVNAAGKDYVFMNADFIKAEKASRK